MIRSMAGFCIRIERLITFFLILLLLDISNLVIGSKSLEVVSHVHKVQASYELLGQLAGRQQESNPVAAAGLPGLQHLGAA